MRNYGIWLLWSMWFEIRINSKLIDMSIELHVASKGDINMSHIHIVSEMYPYELTITHIDDDGRRQFVPTQFIGISP